MNTTVEGIRRDDPDLIGRLTDDDLPISDVGLKSFSQSYLERVLADVRYAYDNREESRDVVDPNRMYSGAITMLWLLSPDITIMGLTFSELCGIAHLFHHHLEEGVFQYCDELNPTMAYRLYTRYNYVCEEFANDSSPTGQWG